MMAGGGAIYWRQEGSKRLKEILARPKLDKPAKNIVLFIGDGMGISTTTAARIFRGQQVEGNFGEEAVLSFENFPYTSLIKVRILPTPHSLRSGMVAHSICRATVEPLVVDPLRMGAPDESTYATDYQVSDSASTATAMFSGTKTKMKYIGMDATGTGGNCTHGAIEGVLTWAQRAGKHTGLVTTSRVTHATPGALYAHVPDRNWEHAIPIDGTADCVDIARHLIQREPGRNIRVVLGGGLSEFCPMDMSNCYANLTVAQRRRVKVFSDSVSCKRTDCIDLISEWERDKAKRGANYQMVLNVKDFRQLNIAKTDFLMGLFADSHMDYEIERTSEQPSLAEMTTTAIKILQKNQKGFFLMVEASRIDHALHMNRAHVALKDVLALDEAVRQTAKMLNSEESLILVTADHSHVMTINGYPKRGENILGNANKFVTTSLLQSSAARMN
ncbi:unnamed protein product [Cyprideis torosa]|uniref:Alkaline phosphatase n=1 Tax=Cyprideis torosa TaxID=163714 RepID=A0A7R8ZXE7_9CRUS|nr:unnamed protein product [Cyprideis torosa]CAG0906993.1 unnamed protein product [Cyprideis torosa]